MTSELSVVLNDDHDADKTETRAASGEMTLRVKGQAGLLHPNTVASA
jgi:hypothetical protein